MTVRFGTRPNTLAGTFSFYVAATDSKTLEVCGSLADAVTVKGPRGPPIVRALRMAGWDRPAIFDRAGYQANSSSIEHERWFDEQASAGADRPLSAGSWAGWDNTGHELRRALDVEARRIENHKEATAVLAIDYRWFTKGTRELIEALRALDRPVALVLAHPSDPLSVTGAVNGLIAVTSAVDDLTILRTDHGGFGALVYGARHAAIGLIPSYRHFVPVGMSAGGKNNDPTPRLFVRDLMDWFTAMTIAGWGVSAVNLRCQHTCCEGRRLDRFFDPRYEAEAIIHNRITLTDLADEILDAPRDERRQRFSRICADAVERYGNMGKLSAVTTPKQQLLQWLFA
jgi:hypothetical protein